MILHYFGVYVNIDFTFFIRLLFTAVQISLINLFSIHKSVVEKNRDLSIMVILCIDCLKKDGKEAWMTGK